MVRAYIEIMRISDSFMAGLAAIIGLIIASHAFVFPEAIYVFFSVFFIAAAGIVLNDYFDYHIDKINAPHRPLPSGRIMRSHALLFSTFLFVFGLFLASLLTIYCLLLAFLNTILEIFYAKTLKRYALIGNATDSWFVASTFIFGALAVDGSLSAILWLSLLAFLSNMGREIFGDLEDIKGDAKLGLKTLPLIIGKRNAAIIAKLFIISAVVVSPLPYFLNILNIYYILFVIPADICFAVSLFKEPAINQKLTKIAMFIALVAFLAGVFL